MKKTQGKNMNHTFSPVPTVDWESQGLRQNCGLSMVTVRPSTVGVMCGNVSPMFWSVRIAVSAHQTVKFIVLKHAFFGQQLKAKINQLNVDALFQTKLQNTEILEIATFINNNSELMESVDTRMCSLTSNHNVHFI